MDRLVYSLVDAVVVAGLVDRRFDHPDMVYGNIFLVGNFVAVDHLVAAGLGFF